MTVSFEILMVAGIVAFYIADSAMLLYVNEYILVQHRGSLRFDFPSLRSQVAGRFLYIPNPFRPDLMLFRGAWSETNPSEQTDCPDFRVLQDSGETIDKYHTI